MTDRATGEVLSYRYREGTTLPESIATIAANPLSWVLGGTVGYLVGGPGSLGLAAGIGAGVSSVAGVGVMHWVQSKGN